MKESLVSVIMPTFNHSKFIKDAIDSVLAQTYSNWELIVINNYSTDNTEEVLSRYTDKRIKVINFNNGGIIARARNRGITEAKGEFIAFLDSDDGWTSDKLQVCIEHFNNGVDLVYHDLKISRDNSVLIGAKYSRGRTLNKPALIDLLVNGNVIINSSVIIRKTIMEQIGGIDENPEMVAAEDYNTWLRIAEITENFCYIPGSLGWYMLHDKGTSRKDMSVPTRIAIAPFIGLLNSKQKRIMESGLSYTKGRYNYLCQNYIIARENLIFSALYGSLMIRFKSVWMLIRMCVYK